MLPGKLKVIISGGGTGGHIFPAIAIADGIKAAVPGAEILFVGAEGRMEMEKVPAAGYPIKALPIMGIQRKLSWKNLVLPFKVIASSWKARSIIKSFNPDVVVGVGGYASGPTLKMAGMLGKPTLIQEQNSYPGLTNKMLAKKAEKICVAYLGMDKYFPSEKIVITGNPVRKDIVNSTVTREEGLKFFGLSPEKPVILAMGGSLGALNINEAMHGGLRVLAEAGIQLIWQTGKDFAPKAQEAVKPFAAQGIQTHAFIKEMAHAYSAADIIVSRAGALAISEICIVEKPCILVPSPYVAEDHQTKNATSLVAQNAALMVANDQTREKLINECINLAANEYKRDVLSENIKRFALPKATEKIVEQILNCVK